MRMEAKNKRHHICRLLSEVFVWESSLILEKQRQQKTCWRFFLITVNKKKTLKTDTKEIT